MTPVTSSPRPFSACLFVLMLAPAVMAAEPATQQEAPALADVSDVEAAPAAAPVAAPVVLTAADAVHQPVADDGVAEASSTAGVAPLAGAVGATVGAGGGVIAAVGATVCMFGLISVAATASGAADWAIVLGLLAELATPTLFVALPALGAGLGAFAALFVFTDATSAALVGVTAALSTPAGIVAGGVAGGAVGALAGLALLGGNVDGYALIVPIVLGGLGALSGAGVGGLVGAAAGGATGGLLVGALE